MDKDKNYITTNLHLATFLCIKGFNLINILVDDKDNPERKVFIFEHSDQLRKMVRIFYFGKNNEPELLVNAREILLVFRDIKNKLHALNQDNININKGQD